MTQIEFRLSWPTSSHRFDNFAVLRATDRASGQTVFEAEFGAEDIAALLANRAANVETEMISAERFNRLGKQYRHELIEIPEAFKRYSPRSGGTGDKPSDEMRAFATAQIEGTEWEGATWTRHNYGWSLRAYKWVAE